MAHHEKLILYKKAITFAWSIYLLSNNNKHISNDRNIKSQIQRASVSISSNIAEWASRWSKKDYIRFLYISRWSVSEVISILRICKEIWYVNDNEILSIINLSQELFKMLNGLIKSFLGPSH